MSASHKLVATLLAVSSMLTCVAANNFTSSSALFNADNTAAITTAAAAAAVTCKHPTEMWGDMDPNVYHVCDAETHMALLLRCPEGCGFFNGLGYYGCIPYAQWPACISGSDATQRCDSTHLKQPWQTADPNTFFMCAAVASEPVLARCEPGRGFVHAQAGVGGTSITGCAEWPKWRMYMQCEKYY